MNDFLQSLRGGQKDKRPQKTRRGFENNPPHYNQTPGYPPHSGFQNPRGGNVKRVTRSNAPSKYPSQEMDMPGMHGDIAERALDMLDGFLKTQERLVDIQQRRIIAEERKAQALEEIAEYLRYNVFSDSASGELSAEEEQKEDDASDMAPPYGAASHGDVASSHEEPSSPVYSRDLHEPSSEDDDIYAKPSEPRPAETPVRQIPPVEPATPPMGLREEDLSTPPEQRDSMDVQAKDGAPKLSRPAAKRSTPRATRRPSIPVKKEVKVIKRTKAEKARASAGESVESTPVKGLLSREEVMAIIEKMRAKGATFDQVAKYLVDIGQPTFSGRGEWHAQTVHRLCNRKK